MNMKESHNLMSNWQTVLHTTSEQKQFCYQTFILLGWWNIYLKMILDPKTHTECIQVWSDIHQLFQATEYQSSIKKRIIWIPSHSSKLMLYFKYFTSEKLHIVKYVEPQYWNIFSKNFNILKMPWRANYTTYNQCWTHHTTNHEILKN